MLHPNQTWFLYCDSNTLYSAPTLWGPWKNTNINVRKGGVPGNYEDPFLYLDSRGNWHVIYHVYNATTPCGVCTGELVSGHSYSVDGVNWHSATTQPFTNTRKLTNGQTVTYSTFERPAFFFNDKNQPTHLLSGTCGGTATCPPTPGVDCKYNYWDFTYIQPLNV